MSVARSIAYAGGNEDTEAYLRLSLRSARKYLQDDWEWVSPTTATVIFAEAPVTTNEIVHGKAWVTLVGADAVTSPPGYFLHMPIHAEALAGLLNRIELAATGIAPAGEEDVRRPLVYFLPKRVLGGPARIALPGAPPLAIDPESRNFWAQGTLPELEPYIRQPLRWGDWQRLADEDLANLRDTAVARPNNCLIWMDTYLQSNGVLSRRLDANAEYRLTRRLELANDYPHALRISAQMTRPRRLDAIARASGVELAELHNVINAYEAIGFLEWIRPGATARGA